MDQFEVGVRLTEVSARGGVQVGEDLPGVGVLVRSRKGGARNMGGFSSLPLRLRLRVGFEERNRTFLGKLGRRESVPDTMVFFSLIVFWRDGLLRGGFSVTGFTATGKPATVRLLKEGPTGRQKLAIRAALLPLILGVPSLTEFIKCSLDRVLPLQADPLKPRLGDHPLVRVRQDHRQQPLRLQAQRPVAKHIIVDLGVLADFYSAEDCLHGRKTKSPPTFRKLERPGHERAT